MILLNDNFTSNPGTKYNFLRAIYLYAPIWSTLLDNSGTNFALPASSPTGSLPIDWVHDNPSLMNSLYWPTGYGTSDQRTWGIVNLLDDSNKQLRGTELDCSITFKLIGWNTIETTTNTINSQWITTNTAGLKVAAQDWLAIKRYNAYNYRSLGSSLYPGSNMTAGDSQIADIDWTNSRVKLSHSITCPAGTKILPSYSYDSSGNGLIGFYIGGKFIGTRPRYGTTHVGWGDIRLNNEWENSNSWHPYGTYYVAGDFNGYTTKYQKYFANTSVTYDPYTTNTLRVVSNGDLIIGYINGEKQFSFEANARKQSSQYITDDYVYLFFNSSNSTYNNPKGLYITNITVKDSRTAPFYLDLINLKPIDVTTTLTPTISWKNDKPARYATEGMKVLTNTDVNTNQTLTEFTNQYGITEFTNITLDGVNLTSNQYHYNDSIGSFVILDENLIVNALDEETLEPKAIPISYLSFDAKNFINTTIVTGYKIPFVSKYYNVNVEIISNLGHSIEHANTSDQQIPIRSTQEKFNSNRSTPINGDLMELTGTTVTGSYTPWNSDYLKINPNLNTFGYGYWTNALPAYIKVDLGTIKNISTVGFIGWGSGMPLRFKWQFVKDEALVLKSFEQYANETYPYTFGEYTELYRNFMWDSSTSNYATYSTYIRDFYILPRTIKARYITLYIYENMGGLNSQSVWGTGDLNGVGRDNDVLIQKLFIYEPKDYPNGLELANINTGQISWLDKELISQEDFNNTFMKYRVPNEVLLKTNSRYFVSIYNEGITKC